MLLAALSLLDAAIARIPLHVIETGGSPAFSALFDTDRNRRLHPVFLWATPLFIALRSTGKVTMSKWVKRIIATRVYDRFDLDQEFLPGVNILHGRNGTGKTTLLHILVACTDDIASSRFDPVCGVTVRPLHRFSVVVVVSDVSHDLSTEVLY
jgi:hypothetical protein